jgi:hypothetical protein
MIHLIIMPFCSYRQHTLLERNGGEGRTYIRIPKATPSIALLEPIEILFAEISFQQTHDYAVNVSEYISSTKEWQCRCQVVGGRSRPISVVYAAVLRDGNRRVIGKDSGCASSTSFGRWQYRVGAVWGFQRPWFQLCEAWWCCGFKMLVGYALVSSTIQSIFARIGIKVNACKKRRMRY